MTPASGSGTAPFVPRRRRGVERLEEPGVDGTLLRRSLADVARANRLFGGTRAVLAELEPLLHELPRQATLLDVGTGLGDIPARAVATAGRHGVRLTTIGLDGAEPLALASRARVSAATCGDARRLPFPDRSIDIVTCSQVLHHFADDDARPVLREMDRVARVRVIVADLRRSWFAAGGIWAASFPLGFHPVSRHDGVVSVLRGYTPSELGALIQSAIGAAPTVRRRLGFRITASWRPSGA